MDFELTAEQHALAEMAGDLFAKLYPPARLRELWNGDTRDPAAWQAMADVGLVGLTVPEEHGGMGGDAVDLGVVLEQAGRAAVPDPLLETAAIAVPLLAAAGSEQQRIRWLPAIATGMARVGVQLADQPHVLDADVADVLLVADGGGVRLLAGDDFLAEPVASEDHARRLFAVTIDPAGGERLPGDTGSVSTWAAFGTAAVLNGVARKLLDLTLEHVKTREQFGRPVGGFQAVKHKLASVFAAMESSGAATRCAAYALARDLPDRHAAASVAFALAVETEALANTEALQCHGGIGFTWEHDLHLWLKRGRAVEHAYASARSHRAALAAVLLDGAPAAGDDERNTDGSP